MEINDYYAFIFKRKSIRNYDLTPLDENTLAEISKYLSNLKPLYDNIKIEMKIISSDEVETRMKKAPHYIAVFSELKEGYLINIGFMLQQMDLFLSAKDIGSCWQGSPEPKEEVLKNSDLEFVILMAFGNPGEPIHRSSVSEFKRKPLSEISSVKSADKVVEAVRLAPSAGNSQPWFLTGDKSIIHVYSSKSYSVKAFPPSLVRKYNNISMGIAIYHLKVALKHFGKKAEIASDETAKMNSPNGYDYIASLKVE
jgi:nitroreductase